MPSVKQKSRREGQVIVILGPTASGKSDMAVKLARKFNGEIISADSRQVYRGLDIGSGKVEGKWINTQIFNSQFLISKQFSNPNSSNKKQTKHSTLKAKSYNVFVYKKIIHHCIDFVNPKKVYSAGEFKERAEKAIDDILSRGKVPIICGGTGFYIQSIVDNLVLPKVEPDWKLRKKLNTKPANELFKMLEKLDPKRAKTIDPKNPHRLIRAIEIAKKLGKVPNLATGSPSKYEFLQIGVKWPEEDLKKRIKKRLLARMKQGMIAEVRKLHKQGVTWKRLYELGLEYRYVSLFLRGYSPDGKKLTLADPAFTPPGEARRDKMIEKLNMEIWHFAKRQTTWFKRDKRIKWLALSKVEGIQKYSNAEKMAKKFLKKKSN